MRNNFSYKGQWFLPNNLKKKVSGISFEYNSGTTLEVIGELLDVRKKVYDAEIILGITTDGKHVTLYNCFETQRTFGTGTSTSKWSIIFSIIGGHFYLKDQLNFHSLSASFYHLNEWLAISGYKIADPDYKRHKSKIEYTLPKQIPFDIDINIKGCFNFTFKPPSYGLDFEISTKQTAHFFIESKTKELHFDELLHYSTSFQDFLTLATYEASFPLAIQLTSNTIQDEFDGKSYPTKYDVFYNVSFSPYSSRPKILWEFLFNYRDIKRIHKKILSKWYINTKEIEPVLKMLLDSFYQRGSFNENKFLNIAQALETFHRRKRKNTVLTDKQHSKRINEIKAAIPRKYSDFINGRLIHSNEPTLHQRLEKLITEFNTKTFSKIVTDIPKFIKQIKDSRNYYTHYDKSLEKKALHGSDLYYLTEKLKVVLVSAILKEIGFTYDLIEKLLSRNEYKYFNHIIER